ncbi:MAG: FAD-dependent oxidoreductase [Oscillospiraceae bacterium]|nr:FAD-dependent oxidoreductase [Oscillospiraceae bacterium]
MKTKYDLIVAGAGYAGFAAAVRAARNGMDVLLFDRDGCAGGTGSASMIVPYMNYWTIDPATQEKIYLNKGLFFELRQHLIEQGQLMANDRNFHDEYVKLIMDRMLIEAGVTVLYHSYLIGADTADGTVRSVTVANKTGNLTFEADWFLDATGDADLTVMCGFPTRLGRESDHLCQPMTTCFRMANVDTALFKEEKPQIQELYQAWQAEGRIKNPRENVLTFFMPVKGIVHFNTTRVVGKNPVDAFDLTAAEMEAREQIFEMIAFLKANFASFKDASLISIGSRIGVRESRMISGEYVLTEDDVKACRKFDDTIAVANYSIDIHSPDGSGTLIYKLPQGEYYTIPYRCLIPKGVKNMLVAGRCISADHVAQASVRIMPICCTMGEAAGTALTLARQSGAKDVREVDVPKLQKQLEAQGLKIH